MAPPRMKINPARIRELREQRAWSQEQLAEIAGINVRTLQRVESKGGGSLETRMALASALGVTPAELAGAAADSGLAASTAQTAPTQPQRETVAVPIAVLLAILFALLLIFGYMFGRDMAQRHRRAEERAAAAQAVEAKNPPSGQATDSRQPPANMPTDTDASN